MASKENNTCTEWMATRMKLAANQKRRGRDLQPTKSGGDETCNRQKAARRTWNRQKAVRFLIGRLTGTERRPISNKKRRGWHLHPTKKSGAASTCIQQKAARTGLASNKKRRGCVTTKMNGC